MSAERVNPFARPVRPPEDGGSPANPGQPSPAPSAFPGARPPVPASPRPEAFTPPAPAAAGPSAAGPAEALSAPGTSENGWSGSPPAAPAPEGRTATQAEPAQASPVAEPSPVADPDTVAEPDPAVRPTPDAGPRVTAEDTSSPYPTEGRPGPDDPRLHEAIRQLRDAIDVVGVMIATSDGLALAYDLPTDDALRIAAMAATGLGLGRRLVDSFGHESFQEQVTRGSDGYFVVYSAGRDAVLAIIAPASCNLGMLHHQSRRVAAHLGDLLAGPET